MSYYENPQWTGPSQSSWDPQGSSTPVRAGKCRPAICASAPQAQDDFAFSYQFDEVDRAYENLQKSGKGFMMGGRRKFSPMHHGHGSGSARSTPDFVDGRMPHGPGSRSHSVNNFDGPSGPPGPNLHNFYANQRHQPSRGTNEVEQVMQAKRRMAAQRERELRNLHTEQQYQRNALAEVPAPGGNKHMSEEETRELIARQRSALYGEGPFAEQGGYVDENGKVHTGAPGPSGPPSLRGVSPLGYDGVPRAPPGAEAGTPVTNAEPSSSLPADPSPRPPSTASPQTAGPTNKMFDSAVGAQSRTSTSSPTGASSPQDLVPGSKPGQSGSSVAPIGTRPSGTPANAQTKRSTTPMGSSGGWGRGNGVWGQSSGLGTQASVWG
ncbi:hypothetical protein GMORB2_7226 [Geosmithia morbida]|uniref:Uncharacterized protein n=1 Tax=Geosmithia morbida TaxID=1094350 RepID=A0A9P4YW82_9HYPO|nr:uncharacterized protein GMORB2_7226 [Geosmithia morbida]KAF4122919.1 hypothetical protein GMORB2_7226 [Geosmithia morbida]